MRLKSLNQQGMGFGEFLLWVALLALLGWAVWELYLHPESLKSKDVGHGLYEDTHQ